MYNYIPCIRIIFTTNIKLLLLINYNNLFNISSTITRSFASIGVSINPPTDRRNIFIPLQPTWRPTAMAINGSSTCRPVTWSMSKSPMPMSTTSALICITEPAISSSAYCQSNYREKPASALGLCFRFVD